MVLVTPESKAGILPPPTTNEAMPTFLVIGAAKAGTSSLHRYLELHPDVAMSKLKEPKYFVREVSPEFLSDVPEFEGFHVASRTDYVALFEPGTVARGESSTAYSNSPQFPGVPEAIHREIPEAKIIYLVRDPIDRIISQFVQWKGSRTRYRRELARQHGLEGLLRDPHDPGPNVISNSLYMGQIRRYLPLFPRESILVIDSMELEMNRRETLTKIFDFIGVEPDFWDPGMLQRFNEGSGKRELFEPYLKLRSSSGIRRAVDHLPVRLRGKSIAVAQFLLSKPIERPVMDQETRSMVEEMVREDVAELRAFTGEDFPSWSV